MQGSDDIGPVVIGVQTIAVAAVALQGGQGTETVQHHIKAICSLLLAALKIYLGTT